MFEASFFSVFGHKAEGILLVSEEFQEVVMVLPKGVSVTHCNQCDSCILHVSIKMTFNINGNSAGAFI